MDDTRATPDLPRNNSLPGKPGYDQHHWLLRVLRSLGADQYDLWMPETQFLSELLNPTEEILGVLYGKYRHDNDGPVGRGLLAATNERLLFVDRKPLYSHYDELVYAVVSGVTYTHVAVATTVMVSTRMGNISFRTFNHKAAQHFVRAVERKLFEQQQDGTYDNDRR